MKRAKIMLGIVVFGLLVAGITVWPAVPELKMTVRIVWGNAVPSGSGSKKGIRAEQRPDNYCQFLRNCLRHRPNVGR